MIDVIVRAVNETALMAKLKGVGKKLTHIDEQGGDKFTAASHEHALHVIGPVVVTPAVIDVDGTITAPAIMDDRCYAMLWVTQEIADLLIAVPGDPNFVQTGADELLVTNQHSWL